MFLLHLIDCPGWQGFWFLLTCITCLEPDIPFLCAVFCLAPVWPIFDCMFLQVLAPGQFFAWVWHSPFLPWHPCYGLGLIVLCVVLWPWVSHLVWDVIDAGWLAWFSIVRCMCFHDNCCLHMGFLGSLISYAFIFIIFDCIWLFLIPFLCASFRMFQFHWVCDSVGP